MSTTSAGTAAARLAALVLCPVCGGDLHAEGATLRCADRHAFDVARQGYVNLHNRTPPGGADAPDMVAARADFLAAGHYMPLAAHLAEQAAACWPGGTVLDVGAGTGYYLAAVLDVVESAAGLALDVSPYALRRAARAHRRGAAVGWDVWRPLPVRSGSVGVVLDVFAPRNAAEYARVLRGDGVLLVVTPGPGHLAELVAAAGMLGVDDRKDARLSDTLGGHFAACERREVRFGLRLSRRDAQRAVLMGPSGHHLDPERVRARLAGLAEPVDVTARVVVGVYRPRRR